MLRNQARRLATTIFVMFTLLFSQLALANFACNAELSQVSPATVSAMDMAPGMPCEEMNAASENGASVICHQHCTNAPQSVDPLKAPTVFLPAVLNVFVVSLVLDTGAAEAAVGANVGQFRPPLDPVFLSTLRLRV